MNAQKRQMIKNTADIIESSVAMLRSDTIDEEDLLKIARTLQFNSMSIQAIVELPDRKGN